VSGAISGASFKDENDMASDSATAVASQQSIKAYVDTEVAGAGGGGLVTVWATFIDTGTAALSDDSGVASIADNGTGDYTLTFDSAFSDANYGVGLASDQSQILAIKGRATTTLNVHHVNDSGSATDIGSVANSALFTST
jgi:hypothetical protein